MAAGDTLRFVARQNLHFLSFSLFIFLYKTLEKLAVCFDDFGIKNPHSAVKAAS